LPVFPTVTALNNHFFKKIKDAIKGQPESTSVFYIILNFFDIGDPIDNLTVKEIVMAVEPGLKYAAITNAMVKLQDSVVNGKFMGVKPMVLENLYIKNKFPKFPEERTPLIIKGHKKVTIMKPPEDEIMGMLNAMQANKIYDRMLIQGLQTNMEKALETVLLKHDDRVDDVLTKFLPFKADIEMFLELIKGMDTAKKAGFIEVMQSVGKAFK
jgi:hypothetical protein